MQRNSGVYLRAKKAVPEQLAVQLARNALDNCLTVDGVYWGVRLALSLASGEEELFSVQDVAAALGCTAEEALQTLHDEGIEPAAVAVSPIFKAALAAWRDEHPAGEE